METNISTEVLQLRSKVKVKITQSCLTLCDTMDYAVHPWSCLGQNTVVGSLSLLQGIFPT